jgi:hypothetical protein
MKWMFNLSYSAYSVYKESELQFYFQYILKSKPDTEVYQIYGDGGQVVHSFAEEYIKDSNIDIEALFNNLWKKYNLDNVTGINNKTLNKEHYISSIYNVKKYIDKIKEKSNNIVTEQKIEYLSVEFKNILIKGYIDLVMKDSNNNITIIDWKTNSSHNFEMHELQRKFYSWLYWKKYKLIPNCEWFYAKKNSVVTQTFTESDLILFNNEIISFLNEILNKGFDISKYSEGAWEGNFNSHYKKCRTEVMKRNNTKQIDVAIKNNKLYFNDTLPNEIKELISNKYKYKVSGCEFSELYQSKKWDGYKRFFSYNSIPLGFIHDFKKFIKEYNEYFNMNLILNFIDMRDKDVINKVYNTKFKKNEYTLYDFQEDCVVKAIANEIGIIYVGTGGGKTLISSEIIRRLNRKSLYLVNRIELGQQVKDNLEEMLGVEIGLMSEGNIITDKQITVASIQTIGSILKRNNKSSLKLKKYLYNISLAIADEAQNIKDIGYYGILRKNLINCKYIIGMTGTPFRSS